MSWVMLRTLFLASAASLALCAPSAASAATLGFGPQMPSITVVGHAAKADPGAPRGADPNWLPATSWVMQRWLPFDQVALYDLLGATEPQRQTYIFYFLNTGRSLAALGRLQGMSPAVMTRDLLANRRGRVRPATYRLLAQRTQLVLGQPHLAQHLLFHSFHDDTVVQQAQRIFGLTQSALYDAVYRDGLTRLQAATGAGRSAQTVRARLLQAEWTTAMQGVRSGAMSLAQAHFRQLQLTAHVEEFLDPQAAVTAAATRGSPVHLECCCCCGGACGSSSTETL